MSSDRPRLKVGIVGKDGRTTAMTRGLEASPRVTRPVLLLSNGRGLAGLQEALDAAERHRPDLVVIGPEEPLALGVVDELQSRFGIRAVGPTQALARLESSKSFTRELLAKHKIPGNPRHRVFASLDGVEAYLSSLGQFVIKPDGLTGGKGVKVSGDHLQSVADGVSYCRELLGTAGARVVIEEKLEGEEFSLQSFCDGTHVADMVPVQDHKRAHDGDTGPNTGGMGSYTGEDHSLPFLTPSMLAEASAINRQVAAALAKETGQKYKGILFGGFMATGSGVKLLEYNARFGDPESLNVLSLLETDLCEIFEAIVDERLDRVPVRFKRRATVCRYIVPEGYPAHPVVNGLITAMPEETETLKVYPAAVEPRGDAFLMTGSRALALVGLGATLDEANRIVEDAARSVTGPVFYRKDIGTRALIDRRVSHMRTLLARAAAASGSAPTAAP
jgi:phosphoribosylamine--glycine ligase